jgi:hypothetical protein
MGHHGAGQRARVDMRRRDRQTAAMPDRFRLRRALLLGLVLGPLVASSHACGDDDATSSSSTVDTSDGAGLPGDIVALDLSVGTSDSPSLDGTTPDDSGAPDDAAPPAEGAFGAPCVDNDSCLSGYCVESDQGPVCSRTCTEDCPGGWSCLGISGGTDVTFLCFPRQDRLCRPCALDGQCGLGLCAPLAEGNRCSTPCDDDGACPDGYVCEDLESQFTPGNASRQCVPDNGACDCVPGKEGFVELCQKQNAFGTCSGLRTCLGAAGWGPCDAPEAAPETCDGLDQNCNGLADENLTGETCVIANEHGRCTGLRVCEAADGQTCVGLTPAPEACNYLDDDCDGDVDEGFRVDGRYTGVNQCGNCFTDCAAIFTRPNAFGVCDASSATPACRMACQPGFFDLNAVPGDGCELALDAGAIYVGRDSPGAAGGACGLGPVGTGDGHFPCRTIADGLARAAATGRKTILVADGLYGEAVTVPNGVSLLGGFGAVTW